MGTLELLCWVSFDNFRVVPSGDYKVVSGMAFGVEKSAEESKDQDNSQPSSDEHEESSTKKTVADCLIIATLLFLLLWKMCMK